MDKRKKLSVEVADTNYKRSLGLMHRKHLGQDEGMLFKFPQKQKLSFWMQNTYIPLEIAFLDDSGKILQIAEMIPMSTKMVSSQDECDMALEVNRGWFKKNNVDVGDKISNIKETLKNISVKKFAQALPNDNDPEQEIAPEIQEEPPAIEPEANQEGEQEQKQQEALNNPKVKINRSIRDIIEYADKNDLPLMIIYRTMEGNTIGPRKFMPINHRYKIKTGPNGEHLEAYDASASISLGRMEIEGGTIKTPLISNIVSLQPVEPNQGMQNI